MKRNKLLWGFIVLVAFVVIAIVFWMQVVSDTTDVDDLDVINSKKPAAKNTALEVKEGAGEENVPDSISIAEKIKRDLPPFEKRMEEYKDLGILDTPCANPALPCMDMKKAGDAIRYSVTALFTKTDRYSLGSSDTHRLNNLANFLCRGSLIDLRKWQRNPVAGNGSDYEILKKYGYRNTAEWCSRRAQMYCDFKKISGTNKVMNSQVDYELNGSHFLVIDAAKYIFLEGGYATCVDKEVLNKVLLYYYHRSIFYRRKIKDMTPEQKEVESRNAPPPLAPAKPFVYPINP